MNTHARLLSVLALLALTVMGIALSRAHATEPVYLTEVGLDKGFTSEYAAVNGVKLHYVRGGKGLAVVLIHGFPQDWFEYRAIMPRLSEHFSVVAVDLRGVGGSRAAPAGDSTAASARYDAATMAEDVYQLVSALKLDRPYIVGHDIGGMVTYAFVRQHPEATRGAAILDAPLPGIAGWDEAVSEPSAWHVHFMQVPDLAEKLVTGRQADFFGYFFQFGKFMPHDMDHYVKAYAAPVQLHAAFEMYRAFPANEKFNKAQRETSDVPLFIAAGERSPFVKLLPKFAEGLRANGNRSVDTGVIHGAVHYVVQDQPQAVAELIERHASITTE